VDAWDHPLNRGVVACVGLDILREAINVLGEVLANALPPLPETADELRAVAKSLGADEADLELGSAATVTKVKQTKLDQYRIVYFATDALVSGETEQAAKGLAEPALVLSLPATATAFDDGLLTSSEVAQLKLNADWVVLSACNTAAADKPGAEALSGLARAFFYADARALLVSHWPVESEPAVKLMTTMFAASRRTRSSPRLKLSVRPFSGILSNLKEVYVSSTMLRYDQFLVGCRMAARSSLSMP
jgi:CHAT domain-containing protein